MSDARAIQIAFVIDEDLRLVDQPAEGGGMHDAIAVALELAAKPRWCLGMAAAARREACAA